MFDVKVHSYHLLLVSLYAQCVLLLEVDMGIHDQLV